jgi:hypothetical protein
MKTLKILGLYALVIMNFTSCDFLFGHREPDIVVYQLNLSFQDASGNDLVKGIGLTDLCCPTNIPEEQAQSGTVKDSLFTLDIILSEPCNNWDNEIYNAPARPGFIPDVNRPKLGMERYNNSYYLTTRLSFFVNACPEEKKLTYKLKCPYVFGDDALHEFVTHWDIPKNSMATYAKCNRIEFEGNEITPTLMNKYYYTATIILNH